MTKRRLRAVFDVNVVLAALLTGNPNSPTAELMVRWRRGEFDLVYSAELRAEYVEKLITRKIDLLKSAAFLADLTTIGVLVKVKPGDVKPVIIADPDDDIVVACAVAGKATHLVTYDRHFDFLDGEYQGIKITDGLCFLAAVRQSLKPHLGCREALARLWARVILFD